MVHVAHSAGLFEALLRASCCAHGLSSCMCQTCEQVTLTLNTMVFRSCRTASASSAARRSASCCLAS